MKSVTDIATTVTDTLNQVTGNLLTVKDPLNQVTTIAYRVQFMGSDPFVFRVTPLFSATHSKAELDEHIAQETLDTITPDLERQTLSLMNATLSGDYSVLGCGK